MIDLQNLIENNSNELFWAAIIFLLTLLVFQLIKTILYSRLRKYDEREIVDAIADTIESIGWITAVVTGLYIVSLYLRHLLNPTVTTAIGLMLIVVWTWEGMNLVARMIDHFVGVYIKRAGEGVNETAYRFLGRVVKVLVVLIIVMLILSNLGFEIDSLLAGLGIGGIAVALAVQAVLGDFISSFSIIADKPFRVGDFVIIDDLMGTVEKIGIRSTRIEALDGEQIIMANSQLVNTHIRNYGKIEKRRSLNTLGVTYSTPHKLLKEIPAMIVSILESNEKIEKGTYRVHLKEYADFSINFEMQFYVLTSNYVEYLNVQQEMLLEIKKKFDEEEIEFAFPTQTVFIEGQASK